MNPSFQQWPMPKRCLVARHLHQLCAETRALHRLRAENRATYIGCVRRTAPPTSVVCGEPGHLHRLCVENRTTVDDRRATDSLSLREIYCNDEGAKTSNYL